MKKENMGIAVIDDGINDGMYNINDILDDIEITPELHIRQRDNSDHFIMSHGTYCAAVIRKYLPNVPLHSVKIINTDGRGKTKQLVKAFEWCVERKIKLINLSLGTVICSDFEYISRAIDYAVERGVIIVAACNNMDIYTCPASLPNIIGVKCDKSGKLKEGQFNYHLNPFHGIDITAFSEHILVNYKGENQKAPMSNSLAAPYITAIVYNFIQEDNRVNVKGIKEKLYHNSVIQEDIIDENVFYPFMREIDIPIVGVYSEIKNVALELANHLSEYFERDEYKITITSNMEMGDENYLKTIPLNYYAKDDKNPVNFESLSIINTIYKPDVIMVVLDNNHFSMVKELLDVSLLIDDGIKVFMNQMPFDEYEVKNFFNKNKEPDYKNIHKNRNYNYNDLEKIYYYILNMLN